MQERRKVHRDRTYLGGQVAFNDRRSTLDCLVRNFSQGGAKITFASTAIVPGELEVMIPQKGESRRARIIWREDRQAGVEFLPCERGTVVSIETARRLRALEADRAALARRVAQLSEPA